MTRDGDNETLVTGIVAAANVQGFMSSQRLGRPPAALLANINDFRKRINLTLPASHQGPNNIYAISIAPSGSARPGHLQQQL
jgi:hypothetical protein